MEPITLYSYYRSSSAYRVRIALEIKNIPYEYKALHLLKDGGEQYAKDYGKINPMAQVPTIVHNGYPLAQSLAIIEYLEALFPDPNLLPKDIEARCHVIKLCEVVNSGIQPLQNLSVLKKIEELGGDKTDWSTYWIQRGFQAFENEMQGGEFSCGDELTAADAFLIPQVYNAERFNVDMTPFSKITSVYEKCIALEPFKKAHPSNQPDTPK